VTAYFSKVWDGLDMTWSAFTFLERYYTVVALIWLAALILRLILRRPADRIVLIPTPPESAPQES
jgi:hypothetical protein